MKKFTEIRIDYANLPKYYRQADGMDKYEFAIRQINWLKEHAGKLNVDWEISFDQDIIIIGFRDKDIAFLYMISYKDDIYV